MSNSFLLMALANANRQCGYNKYADSLEAQSAKEYSKEVSEELKQDEDNQTIRRAQNHANRRPNRP